MELVFRALGGFGGFHAIGSRYKSRRAGDMRLRGLNRPGCVPTVTASSSNWRPWCPIATVIAVVAMVWRFVAGLVLAEHGRQQHLDVRLVGLVLLWRPNCFADHSGDGGLTGGGGDCRGPVVGSLDVVQPDGS